MFRESANEELKPSKGFDGLDFEQFAVKHDFSEVFAKFLAEIQLKFVAFFPNTFS